MDASLLIRTARRRSGLTLRALAAAAGTSHATLSAYEHGRAVPTVGTLDRILAAAGFALETALTRRIGAGEPMSRGDELAAVIELAEAFPARHSPTLAFPPFGR